MKVKDLSLVNVIENETEIIPGNPGIPGNVIFKSRIPGTRIRQEIERSTCYGGGETMGSP